MYVRTGIAGNFFTSFYNADMGIVSDGLAFQPEEQGQPVVLHHGFFVEHRCAERIHLFQRFLCRGADTVSGSRIPVGRAGLFRIDSNSLLSGDTLWSGLQFIFLPY